MSSGTRGQGRGGRHHGDDELPPPPTMAQVLQNIENNRVRTEHLLERVAQNTERRPNVCATLGDFLKAQPSTFGEYKEPLEADDWLRTI